MAEFAGIEPEKIAKEMRQYNFIETLFQDFRTALPKWGPENKHKNAALNVFGRFLQIVQLFNTADQEAAYPLLPQQPFNENLRTELERMLQQNLRANEDTAKRISNQVFDSIEEFLGTDLEDEPLPDVAVRYTESGTSGKLFVGDFQTRNCLRIRYLAQTYGTDATALMCLRYAHLCKFYGGESGMCVSGLDALYDVGHVTYEGFSSPLNCRLLGRDGVKFCSLFNDTDAAFGSLGNFFRLDLSGYPGGWSLGPPFVEPVLNATAERVLETLEDAEPGKFWFFVTFPHWDDNTGWQRLDESPQKVARIDFNQQEFLQQDNYGIIYRPLARICIFILGQLPDDVDLIELRNGISQVNEARVRDDWLEACMVQRQ
ncbi:hypothetical protein BOX15_Mlig015920g3 [Macrostomum lignano]|uniref:PCIF1 WW domain-containing protein n=1 Tax=Macrostomum lignano TaxID=282301 RepID=A0A267DRY1_9PLAT|nr:hypothetical protein BOX15_Mlig015920g3 [Macrostomum lignano]